MSDYVTVITMMCVSVSTVFCVQLGSKSLKSCTANTRQFNSISAHPPWNGCDTVYCGQSLAVLYLVWTGSDAIGHDNSQSPNLIAPSSFCYRGSIPYSLRYQRKERFMSVQMTLLLSQCVKAVLLSQIVFSAASPANSGKF